MEIILDDPEIRGLVLISVITIFLSIWLKLKDNYNS